MAQAQGYEEMNDPQSNKKWPEIECPRITCYQVKEIKIMDDKVVKHKYPAGYRWTCKAATVKDKECPTNMGLVLSEGYCIGTTCDYDSAICSSGKGVVVTEHMGISKAQHTITCKGKTAHQGQSNMYSGRRHAHDEYNDRMSSQQAFNGYDHAYDAGYYYRAAQPQQYLYGAAASDVGGQYSMAVLMPILLMVVCCVGIICACFGVVSGWFCYFVAKGNNETSNHSKYSRVEPYNDQEV